MSSVINTNPAATLAAYNLGRTNDNLQRSLNRLSSGSRINSSYDDAGGLAVSMKMSAAIRRAESYAANIQNARSFLQTQDGALAQLGKLLERMSELKALAHDVTKNGGDVSNYETEYVQLQRQFTATTVEKFNGINLFSPTSTPDPLFLTHPERGDDIQISRPTLGNLHTGETLRVGNRADTSFSTIKEYSMIVGTFDWHQAKADAESKGGHLATVGSAAEWAEIAPIASGSTVWLGATDESSEGTWEWVDGTPFTFSNWEAGQPDNISGVNPLLDQDYLLQYPNLKWDDRHSNEAPGTYILEKEIQTSTEVESQLRIRDLPWSDLQSSIQQVANARAQNGAEQMRLEMAADLNSTNILNMESAVSRIMDVDIAEESVTLARSRVLQQAGTAMLAQANQSSQSILKLIQMN
jgi:flagellin-like hook-associated protein FlgL